MYTEVLTWIFSDLCSNLLDAFVECFGLRACAFLVDLGELCILVWLKVRFLENPCWAALWRAIKYIFLFRDRPNISMQAVTGRIFYQFEPRLRLSGSFRLNLPSKMGPVPP